MMTLSKLHKFAQFSPVLGCGVCAQGRRWGRHRLGGLCAESQIRDRGVGGEMSNCKMCSRELAAATGAGRPPRYCSVACRRAAEFEIRRLDKRIDGLEDQISLVRRSRMMVMGVDVDLVEAEILRLRDRLLELLGDGSEQVDGR